MAITIPLNGIFKITIKLRRVGTAGEAIAGISFYQAGTWYDSMWIRLLNPKVGQTYTFTLNDCKLNNTYVMKPNITKTGVYGGLGAAWGGYISLGTISLSGTFGDGTQYIVYRAGTGELKDRGNEIEKINELNVTSAIVSSEIVDWYLSK